MKAAAYVRNLSARPTGRGVVAREVLSRLTADPAIDWDIFAGEDPGFPRARFHAARGGNLFSDAWRSLRGIGSDLRDIRPDVLWSATHLLPGALPKEVPTVVTLLDVVWRDVPDTMSGFNRWVAGRGEGALAKADRILCISEFTRSRLIHHWPELAAKSEAVLLGPNSRLVAAPTVDLKLPKDRPWVVNVDTIEPRKNLGVLLDAASDFRIVQAGGVGWNVDGLVARAKAMPNVTLMGYVDEPTLASLYRGALCAVFPSIYEGFHLPPLDAASLGCPVLLSDIPVHREVFGDAALYFSDARGLADLLKQLASDARRREDLGRRARERSAAFSWDTTAREVAQALRKVIR